MNLYSDCPGKGGGSKKYVNRIQLSYIPGSGISAVYHEGRFE